MDDPKSFLPVPGNGTWDPTTGLPAPESFDLTIIDKMVEFARNALPPIAPGIGPDGREYYYLATGAEQAANVIRGEVQGLPKPTSVVADVREDGSWSVWVMGEDGSALLCCRPEFYCKVAGCTLEELIEKVGLS